MVAKWLDMKVSDACFIFDSFCHTKSEKAFHFSRLAKDFYLHFAYLETLQAADGSNGDLLIELALDLIL